MEKIVSRSSPSLRSLIAAAAAASSDTNLLIYLFLFTHFKFPTIIFELNFLYSKR